MLENLRNYFLATLPWDVGRSQYLRLFGTVFALVFAGSVLLHLLLRDAARPMQLAVHAVLIGFAYTIVVGLACLAIYASRRAIDRILVWHVWLVSFLAFYAGYYFLPFGNETLPVPSGFGGTHRDAVSFYQLVPVWGLATYFFVQPYLTESLRSELAKLREVNALLESGTMSAYETATPIRFRSGKTDFVLDAAAVRNIAVDDHYCYVHYRGNDSYVKRDLAMPLRDVSQLLPAEFVQVHRSHIVNLRYVRTIRRRDRNLRLILDGEFEVPVSRHRLDGVLPLLRRQLGANA